MAQRPGSFISEYGSAPVSIALAIWIRLLLDPLLGTHYPFATVLLGILVSAWYGGFRPALAAVVLGAFASDYFLLPPRGSLHLTGPDQQVGMALYLFTGLGISLLAGSMHTARRRAEASAESVREANDQLEARVHERTRALTQSNDQLRTSEERFRLIVEGISSHAIFMLDPAGNVASWNPGAEHIQGYQAAEIVGQHFSRFHTPEDISSGKPQKELEQAITNGRFQEEGVRVRKDDSRFWASVTITPLFDGHPDPIGFINITQDITERKQAEAALKETEDRLEFALHWSHTGGWDLDPVTHSAHRTLEHDRIFGYDSLLPEWNYEMFLEHVLPEDRAEVDRLFHEAITTQTDWSFECRIRRADGEVRWIWAAGGHRCDDRGRPQRITGIVQDITVRKIAEEALQESEEHLRLLLEGVSGHAIFMLDPAGTILTWNSGAESIDGYSADEIIGKHYSCFFTPESIAGGLPKQELKQAAAHGKADVEGWRVRKDGSRFWANGTLAALYDADGKVRGFAKVIRDLTAKRRNDELLQSVLNHTLDAIISIDEHGIVSMINRAGEILFGRTGSEVVGQNVKILMPEPYRGQHDGYLANYLRTGEAKIIGIGREVQGLHKNGSTFPVDLAVTEFQLENKRYFVGILRDISFKKKLEAQLHQSQKMEAFGQLAGGVAHDFNNLLTVIAGYSELLMTMVPPDEETQEVVGEIRDAGERASALTRQLLAFSRQQVLEPRLLDLNAVVTETEKMLRRLIGEDVALATLLRPTISSVKVDPGQIQQVIMNLAVNARDAMPQGGKLTIETSDVELDETYAKTHPEARPGRFVMLAISDTGCGMTPEVKARVFEPFYTTKRVGHGTGLGLAVVHGILKQSGGNIDVYSEVGSGTTFKIYLPAVREQPANLSDSGLEPSSSGTETVLLVEDEDGVRKLAARALRGAGYTVLTAPGGNAALRLMESHRDKIDLLLTDVVMPEMSGRQLAETVWGRHPQLKVLFMSGYTDDAIVRHGVLQADVAFLQKPFTPKSLTKKVREVLDQE